MRILVHENGNLRQGQDLTKIPVSCTRAELRAGLPGEASVALVFDPTQPGLSRTYVYDPADTTSPDNDSDVLVTSGGRRYKGGAAATGGLTLVDEDSESYTFEIPNGSIISEDDESYTLLI